MDILRNKRIEYQMTQEEIAQKIGAARSSYTHIEIGDRKPSPRLAKRIAAVLGFDWTLFFPDEPDQEQTNEMVHEQQKA